jgi:hypothetical protein
MSCLAWRGSLIDLARERLFDVTERNRITSHLSICPECRLFMDQQIALTAAATALAGEMSVLAPPPDLESVVLAEFVAVRSSRPRYWKPLALMGAIAAGVVIAWVVPRERPSQPQPAATPERVVSPAIEAPPPVQQKEVPPAVRAHNQPSPTPAGTPEPQPFLAIPYTVPLDPGERATLMRMQMPVTALTAVGLTVATPDPGASAQADVIVGEDGRIRAIRLLSISDSISDRSIHQ